MALPRRERLLVLVVVLAFIAVLPGCNESDDEPLGPPLSWAERQGFAENAEAIDGAKIFAQVGCAVCHTYLGYGASNVGAPDLSSIGKSSRSAEGFAAYAADPSKFGNNVMPKFADLGEANLRKVGTFLKASKGPK
jgi:mono/diheme cytochrome c family protein